MAAQNGAPQNGPSGGGAAGGVLLIGGGITLALGAVLLLIWGMEPAPEVEPAAKAAALNSGGGAVVAKPKTLQPAAEAPSAPTAAPATEAAAETAPEVMPEGPTEGAPEAAPDLAPAAAPDLGFDTVRVTPEGEALVAGRAEAGATVVLRVDEAEAATAVADGQGNFVAMFTLPPSDQPRLLSLADEGPPEQVAEQTVALAPIAGPAAPEVSAEATPPDQTTLDAAATAEPQPPQALLLTEAGAQVLQAPTSAAQGQVSIDAISYTPDGAVQLSGHAAPGATLRLYLDNAPLTEVLTAAGGQWFTTLRDVAPGLYTLRADQISPDGKVSSRFETPFLRETPEALAAALKPQAITGQPRDLAQLTTEPGAAAAVAPVPAPIASIPEAQTQAAAAPATPPATSEAPLRVTVQPGFTLWRIARENFGDGVLYVKVFEANKNQIRDPDLIYPGQVFTIPKG